MRVKKETSSVPGPKSEAFMLKEVHVREAVGIKLAHDLTQIVPEKYKGPLFKKGHIIQAADIPFLLDIGKEHIYTMDIRESYLHEEEAAERLASVLAGRNVSKSSPHEGKVTLKAAIHGLVKIDKNLVDRVNAIDQIALSTIRTNLPIEQGQSLAGTRVIPLLIHREKITEVERIAAEFLAEGRSAVEVIPFRKLRVGMITTGSELFYGRIEDKFGPVVKQKVAAFGSEVIDQRFTPDDKEMIIHEICSFLEREVDMVLVTGGMSVDPDDRTAGAIAQAGADIVSYGTPMLPGSMLMVAYIGEVPVLGLPGCVMHDPHTSFDELLPRICAGERIGKRDIVQLGYGGYYGC